MPIHTMLADVVQIVKVTAHVVPQPVATAIKNHTILLTVVIIGLVFAPGRLQNNVTY